MTASPGVFTYRAIRQDGGQVRGTLVAEDRSAATARLRGEGLYPLELSQRANPPRRRARPRDSAIFFRGLSALVSAGVPLDRALTGLAPSVTGELGQFVPDIRRRLREGESLASALNAEPGLFPGAVLGMIRAGERGGRLAAALDEVGSQLEQEAELVARVRQALAYPTVLLVTGSVSVIVIVTLVVPRFAALLSDMGTTVPLTTRLLLAMSGALARFGGMAALLLAAGSVLLVQWVRQPAGRLVWDRFLLGLPILGEIRHALGSSRFGLALGGMLAAGVPLLPALDTITESLADQELSQRLERSRARVARGEPFASALKAEAAVTEPTLQVIGIGEASGQLALLSQRAGMLARQDAEHRLRTAVQLVEPALIVGFGLIVGFVALALLQAVYGIRIAR